MMGLSPNMKDRQSIDFSLSLLTNLTVFWSCSRVRSLCCIYPVVFVYHLIGDPNYLCTIRPRSDPHPALCPCDGREWSPLGYG
jgi:hypothetical protein